MLRRQHLALTGSAVALVLGGCDEESPQTCAWSDEDPAEEGVEPAHVEDIAGWIVSADDESLVDELRGRIESGDWTVDAVYAGLLLAGARGIDSKYGGGGFHYVLVVHALRLAAQAAPASEMLVPLVYGILKTRATIAGDDFHLPEVDLGDLPSSEGAAERLLAAAESRDIDGATREAVALSRAGMLGDTLLELGSRRPFQLGHEAIAAAKVVPLLRDMPGAWSEDVVRALVFMFVSVDKAPLGLADHTDVWRANRLRVSEVPCDWLEGEDDDGAPPGIAAEIRLLTDPGEAVEVVERALDRGWSAKSIFDGLILASVDRAHGSGDVHALTAVEALRAAHLLALGGRVRLLLLFQAGAYVALSATMSADAVPLTEIVSQPSTLDEVFTTSGPATVARALGYLEAGGDVGAFVERVMLNNRMRAKDEHAYKLAQAALAEAERVPAVWKNHLLATCRLYAPIEADASNDAWLRAVL